MKLPTLIAFFLVVAKVCGSNLAATEELKSATWQDIRRHQKADPDRLHSVVFATKPQNLEALTNLLHQVSDPASKHYGQHLTRSEVNSMTIHHNSCVELEKFLSQYQLHSYKKSKYENYVHVTATVQVLEQMLKAEFFEFAHERKSHRKFVRSMNYTIPSVLRDHIQAVFNTAQMPCSVLNYPESLQEKDVPAPHGYITPALLNSVYNVTNNTGNDLTTQAIYGNLHQSVSPTDLTMFQTAFDLLQQSITAGAGGHVSEGACSTGIGDCIEASLDTEYIMAIAQNVPTQYYYWSGEDVWLDWITTVADMDDPPKVFTISYGSYEFFMSPAYLEAFNIEAIKLGVMGTTILAASGDDGVAGFAARILGPAFCDYLPMFPASSPYVTAVGGTMGPERGEEEVACQSSMGGMITSGGGFSYVFPGQPWQDAAVNGYLENFLKGEGGDSVPAFGYPRNMRGYPDVSLLANRFVVVAQGGFYQVSGTSGSCPVMAGMVSLVNSARRAAGNSTLGWLNPALYALRHKFVHDITSGDNRCLAAGATCCKVGFTAAEGWDPVTGLGSIDFERFKAAMMDIAVPSPAVEDVEVMEGQDGEAAQQPKRISELLEWEAKSQVTAPASLPLTTVVMYVALVWMLCGAIAAMTVVVYKSIFRRGYVAIV